MPQAVTHVLIVIILLDIFRDYILKKKHRNKFPMHYLIIAGIAGLLPDIDIAVYWILKLTSGVALTNIHRTFTHTLFLPAIFLLLGFIFWSSKSEFLEKHKMKLRMIFFVMAFGTLMHLLLDYLLSGYIIPFYPFSYASYGLNLIELTPWPETILPALDAILLLSWLIHEEIKHKISDFI